MGSCWVLLEKQLALETGHGQATTVARKEASPIPSHLLEAWGAAYHGCSLGLLPQLGFEGVWKSEHLIPCISAKGGLLLMAGAPSRRGFRHWAAKKGNSPTVATGFPLPRRQSPSTAVLFGGNIFSVKNYAAAAPRASPPIASCLKLPAVLHVPIWTNLGSMCRGSSVRLWSCHENGSQPG